MTPKFLVGVLVMAITAGCSKANFSRGDSESGALGLDGGSALVPARCTEVLQTVMAPVKVILSVDTSGSNVSSTKAPATDPTKSRRGNAIQSFFSSYSGRSNFSWSLLHFQEGYSASLIAGNFSSNASQMENAINLFYSIQDRGSTPYVEAIRRIGQVIASDSSATSSTKYIVVFVSDGRPDPEVDFSVLMSEIQRVTGFAPGQITFNTIYYGPTNLDAVTRLKSMAAVGGGSFADASDGASIAIEAAVRVPGSACNH